MHHFSYLADVHDHKVGSGILMTFCFIWWLQQRFYIHQSSSALLAANLLLCLFIKIFVRQVTLSGFENFRAAILSMVVDHFETGQLAAVQLAARWSCPARRTLLHTHTVSILVSIFLCEWWSGPGRRTPWCSLSLSLSLVYY